MIDVCTEEDKNLCKFLGYCRFWFGVLVKELGIEDASYKAEEYLKKCKPKTIQIFEVPEAER